MENDFFELYEGVGFLNVQIGHNRCADWCLVVYDRKVSSYKHIINIQTCDRKELFADAYCKLAKYMCDKYGGY